MKKIFATIIALAALVSCNTEAVDEVVSTPQYLTTSLEVDLDGDTRVFDNNLVWSWESTDEIAAYQADGTNNYLNKLTLNQENNFGSEEFKYTTAEQSTFVFVYPYDAFINTEKLGYVQTGVWTPTLVGTTSGTIDNLGAVKMVHASAAFEIRVWEEGRQARKAISAATISSTADFCNATTATVSGLNSDTVVFNIAEGTFPFDITLTATDGKTYTVSKELTFELGKRTILNVEWKKTASYSVYTSYTDKNNSLDGHTIYVENVAVKNSDAKSVELYINGKKHSNLAVDGQLVSISGLAVGEYNTYIKLTDGEYSYTSKPVKVYVTGIPAAQSFNDLSAMPSNWTSENIKFTGRTGDDNKVLRLYGNETSSKSGWVRSPLYYVSNNIAVKVTVEWYVYSANKLWWSSSVGSIFVNASSSNVSFLTTNGVEQNNQTNYHGVGATYKATTHNTTLTTTAPYIAITSKFSTNKPDYKYIPIKYYKIEYSE